jgi:hypothetical protein
LGRIKLVKAEKQGVLLAAFAVALLVVTGLVLLLRVDSFVRNVSAVDSVGVGVYWDRRHTMPVTSIDWGTLAPGSSKRMLVYLRNENSSTIRYIFASTGAWVPSAASGSMKLTLEYSGAVLVLNQTVNASLTLYVSDKIVNVTTFSFDIVVGASQYYAGDVNHDGNVGPADLAVFSRAYGSTPADPKWNSDADFDHSGKIDAYDFSLMASNYGKKS